MATVDLGISGLENATQIGSGASAVVYRARQSDLGREVAIKVLSSVDEDFVRRFKREARTLGKLSQNQGIVTVYDFGETANGHPYLVLELCSSSLLEQLKASGPLDPRHACAALADVCDAVGEAHDIGVVHRDIKPGNILISPNGRYLITDFGISTVTGATMGQTSTVGFTAAYAAPETFQSGESGPPTDVYALGATLFHLVTGNPPFVNPEGDTNLLAVLHRVSTEPVLDLRPLGIPDPVCQIIESAMAKSAVDRPSMQQLAAQLRHINQTGELAFPIPPLSNENSGPTNGMTSVMGTGPQPIEANPLFDSAGSQGQTQPRRSQPTSQMALPALSAREQQYIPRSEQEKPRSSRGMAAVLMVAVIALVSGIIVATQLGGNDADVIGASPETPQNSNQEVVGGELSSDGENSQDPNSPSTLRESGETENDELDSDTQEAGNEDEDENGEATSLTVPGVVGAQEDSAVAVFDAIGLQVRIEYASSPTVPEGSVISTTPSGGTQTASTSVVLLTVSSGSEAFPVDDVVGDSEQVAVSTLSASGFSPGVITESSNSITKGLVIRTDPPAGRKIGKDAAVTVVVSSGPDGCTGSEVPNVVGKSGPAATQQIEDNGLVASVAEKISNSVDPGNVISSTPPASACVEADSTVNLIVSCQSAVIADLVGQDGSDLSALSDAGFTIVRKQVEGTATPDGDIVSIAPVPGTTACTPATVTVSISKVLVVCDVVVPNVVGGSRAAATTALAAEGLTTTVETVSSPTVAAGLVVGTTPTAGTAVCANSAVVLQISSGPACTEVAIPNVVGAAQTAAVSQLSAFDLTIVSEENSVPAGDVIKTVPAAGVELCDGAAVRVVVSTGPAAPTTTLDPDLVTVPRVVGDSYPVAAAKLAGAGFTTVTKRDQLYPVGSEEIGKVTGQSPAAGTKHNPGTRNMIITVGVVEP